MPKKKKAPPALGNENGEQEEEKEEEKEEQEPPRVPSAAIIPGAPTSGYLHHGPSVINAQRLILAGIAEMRAGFGIESESESEEEQVDPPRALSAAQVRRRHIISLMRE